MKSQRAEAERREHERREILEIQAHAAMLAQHRRAVEAASAASTDSLLSHPSRALYVNTAPQSTPGSGTSSHVSSVVPTPHSRPGAGVGAGVGAGGVGVGVGAGGSMMSLPSDVLPSMGSWDDAQDAMAREALAAKIAAGQAVAGPDGSVVDGSAMGVLDEPGGSAGVCVCAPVLRVGCGFLQCHVWVSES